MEVESCRRAWVSFKSRLAPMKLDPPSVQVSWDRSPTGEAAKCCNESFRGKIRIELEMQRPCAKAHKDCTVSFDSCRLPWVSPVYKERTHEVNARYGEWLVRCGTVMK